MATATLRGILVIAAVILGVFVLSKAFPTAGEVPQPTQQEPQGGGTESPLPESPEPSPTGSPVTPEDPDACPDPADVMVAVHNGTDTEGLAASVAKDLERAGYTVPEENIGNASQNYEQTTIFFRNDARAAAQCLSDELFPDALTEKAPSDADQSVQITVVLGADAVPADEG